MAVKESFENTTFFKEFKCNVSFETMVRKESDLRYKSIRMDSPLSFFFLFIFDNLLLFVYHSLPNVLVFNVKYGSISGKKRKRLAFSLVTTKNLGTKRIALDQETVAFFTKFVFLVKYAYIICKTRSSNLEFAINTFLYIYIYRYI